MKIQSSFLILGLTLTGVTIGGIVNPAKAAILNLDGEQFEISNVVGYTSKSSPNSIKALKFDIDETNSAGVIASVTAYTKASAFPDLTQYDPIYWLTEHSCSIGGIFSIKCEIILDNIRWPFPWPKWPKFKDTTYIPPDPLTDSEEASLDDYTVDVAIPEPLTILGVITAAGFGAGFKRRFAQSKKNS